MRSNTLKVTLTKAVLAVSVLLLGVGVAFAQSVSLTAAPGNASLPDGNVVPMWGYTCSAAAVVPATCAASNPAAGTNWSPVVITVPPGPLTINLTNSLPTPLATSLVIVGQLGGGLGNVAQRTTAPAGTTAGTAYPATATTAAVNYDADVALVLSEIDPAQNRAVDNAVNTP